MKAHAGHAEPADFAIDPDRAAPRKVTRAGTSTIEAIFKFETAQGRGNGILRLIPDADDGNRLKAWTLLTALEELKGFEEQLGSAAPRPGLFARFSRPQLARPAQGSNRVCRPRPGRARHRRRPVRACIAARLKQLQVDTLIVDREARIGDNWRKRYHALTLHNQVQVNHLPYMLFPPNWPTYIPKDKLANWFEAYVEGMELNFWTDQPSSRAAATMRKKDAGPWSCAAPTAASARCIRAMS